MINVPLLTQTLAHIEANPSEWDQTWYRCDTGMCFAGWAAQLAGGKWHTSDPDLFDDLDSYLIAEPGDDPATTTLVDGSGVRVVFAPTRARRLLGLSSSQACELFASGNRLDDLRRIVARLVEEAA